jgi:16S rRNA (guanine527-N7)-methyltransferase
MEQEIINSYSKLSGLNVSRETFSDLESYISMILEKNEKINLISKKFNEKNDIIQRHIIDSAQIIDIVDFNSNIVTDIGSGGGMPGIIIAILLKHLKKDIKVKLYEKSYHKSHFLKDVSRKLTLKTEIIQKNIFDEKKIETGTIMSRAFKPMPIVLDLVNENFSNFTNIIFFMGKSGRETLKNTLKEWDLEYTEKKSLTSAESFLINVKKIKRKNKKRVQNH